MRSVEENFVLPLYGFQKRSIRQFNSLLKDKDIVCIEKKDDWYVIEYTNGQKFKCRGLVVNNANIYEKPKVVKKRLF